MYPVLLRIGPVEIFSFGVMTALSAVVCSLLMARDGRRLGIKPQEIYDLVFWGALGGIIGSRLFYIALNVSFFWSEPSEILLLNRGGLAWQGGLIVGGAAVMTVIKHQKRPLGLMADFIAPYLALGHAIGRIGCFLNGCCYGRETPWGIYFPVHQARLHPTQLYEAVALAVLFFLLMRVRASLARSGGAVFSLYLAAAAAIRFAVEFFRADHEPLFLQLSIFQYVSLVLMIVGAALFVAVRRRHV